MDAFLVVGCLLAWAAGIITHFAKKKQSESVTFAIYWKTHPYLSAASIALSLGAALVSLHIGETSQAIYFGYGYIADSLVNRYKKD